MTIKEITETRLVPPPDSAILNGEVDFREVDEDEYAAWIFQYHDNGWVLLAIRPDGLHIFGKYEGVE